MNAWASIEVLARILLRERAAQIEYAASVPPPVPEEEKPNVEVNVLMEILIVRI